VAYCTKCGAVVPDTARFCHKCGNQLSDFKPRTSAPGVSIDAEAKQVMPVGHHSFCLSDLVETVIIDWPFTNEPADKNVRHQASLLDKVRNRIGGKALDAIKGRTIVSRWPIKSYCLADFKPSKDLRSVLLSWFLFPLPRPRRQEHSIARLTFKIPDSGYVDNPELISTQADELAPEELSFFNRMHLEIGDAPTEFQKAFEQFSYEDWQAAEHAFLSLSITHPWNKLAECCKAYCLQMQDRHRDAVALAAQVGTECAIRRLCGAWCYFSVMVVSNNMTDELMAARAAVEEAVSYFGQQQGSELLLASHYDQKANILKQLAANLSQDPSKTEEAKKLVIEAAFSICRSLEINPNDSASMQNELAAIARIAARVGVRGPDLKGLDALKGIEEVRQHYFADSELRHQAMFQYHNQAVDAFNQRNYRDAAEGYFKALEEACEQTDEDRAFKALIAYEHGLSLLRMSGLEKVHPKQIPRESLPLANRIRDIWHKAIALSVTSGEAKRLFDEELAPGAGKAMANDFLMRGEPCVLRGMELRKSGRDSEAIEFFIQAVDYLDERVPRHHRPLVAAHLELASLLDANGRSSEAGEHARWILAKERLPEPELQALVERLARR